MLFGEKRPQYLNGTAGETVEKINLKVFGAAFFKKLLGSNPTQWILRGKAPALKLFCFKIY